MSIDGVTGTGTRQSWDDYFLGLATAAATRSNCTRRVVGAVLVQGRHVRSTGYNGPPSGYGHCDEGACPRGAAERGINVARSWNSEAAATQPAQGDPVQVEAAGAEPGDARPAGTAPSGAGPADAEPADAEADRCVAVHAEANALLFAEPRDRAGATLYATGAPCFTCAKLIANSGVGEVVAAGGRYDGWDATRRFLHAGEVRVRILDGQEYATPLPLRF